MTKLSIIVPVYNVAPYLRKCVDSLLTQDFEDYEVILVDDGSTDGSGKICDELSETINDERLAIRVIHQENAGLSAARNAGLKVAKGEYVCFVDSDDYWEENVLGELMAQVERDKLDVLRFRLQYVRIKNEGVKELRSEGVGVYEVYNPYKSDPFKGNDYSETVTDGVTFLNTRMNTQCYAWTFIIKQSLIVNSEEIREKSEKNTNSLNANRSSQTLFTEKIYFEDTDWTPRMLVRAKRVASTDTIVYNYLVRQGSITNATNRAKQKKVLDDKMRLVGELQRQANELDKKGLSNMWFGRMIADTVISIVGMLSTDFYEERKEYMENLDKLKIYPIQNASVKARLINLSPRLAVGLLHLKNA